MARLRGLGLALLLAASAALAPGCLFCGGQTGECGADDEDAGETSASCPDFPRQYAEPTAAGHSAADVIAALGGTYLATVDLSAAADGEAVAAPPATLVIAYDAGAITEDSCSHVLTIEVTVTVELGEGTVARAGRGWLTGDPASAHLAAALPAGGDAIAGEVSLDMSLAADGTASGRIVLGDTGPLTFTAARQP